MTEPTLGCRDTGQQVPYQIHQGLAPMYVLQLSERWNTEKHRIMGQLIADAPGAAAAPNVFVDNQLPAYWLFSSHWVWLEKDSIFNTSASLCLSSMHKNGV